MIPVLLKALLIVAAFAALAAVPLVADGYQLSLSITLLNATALATAWALFSGPTRYVSLATAAFFGVGAYTVAVLGETLPWMAVLAVAAAVGAATALAVGLSTLRLSGVYFVIFTFGLAELVRQLVTWYEVNQTRVVGRYIFLDVTQDEIYWRLLILTAVIFAVGWLIARSRIGFALRIIGDDETVAAHCGVNLTAVKVVLFAVSATFMTLAGAVMAPRWTYIDPSIAFNPTISFQVLIMALLGGVSRLYGPLLGVVPMTLLLEFLQAKFPNSSNILLGVVFVLIVYALPRGVVGLFDGGRFSLATRLRRRPA